MYNVTPQDFKRINNDTNGNPRYVCHFLKFINEQDEESIKENFGASLSHNPLLFTSFCYDEAMLKAKKIGGKRFHNKQYGGGVVFQSYSIQDTCNRINQLLNK